MSEYWVKSVDLDKNACFVQIFFLYLHPKLKCIFILGMDKLIGRERECEELKWALDSSGALAVITVTVINGELDGWITKHRIDYRMAS